MKIEDVIIVIILGFVMIFILYKQKNKQKNKKELLKYSFVDNGILLKTETIEKNGFYEVWRQESDGHSIQILCFNPETKEFQAFDRFHWMDEPIIVINSLYYKEDLWTPIVFHYTLEWLKEHIV